MPAQSPRASCLLLHGLNLRPEKMSTLADLLVTQGIACLIVALTGHQGSDQRSRQLLEKIDSQIWRNEVDAAWQELTRQGQKRGPLFLLGYSLGGLLALDLLIRQPLVQIHQIFFLAPAFAIRPRSEAFLHSLRFLPKSWWIPSLNQSDYLMHKQGMTVAGYLALLKLFSEVQKNAKRNLPNLNVPSLVIMDKRDVLISSTRVQDFILRNNLKRWRVEWIQSQKLRKPIQDFHTVVDQAGLGSQEWQRLSTLIAEFFQTARMTS